MHSKRKYTDLIDDVKNASNVSRLCAESALILFEILSRNIQLHAITRNHLTKKWNYFYVATHHTAFSRKRTLENDYNKKSKIRTFSFRFLR